MPRRSGSSRKPFSKGTYVLVLRGRECRLSIGSLGERIFSSGWYGYIGSAQGPGGFARVRRHYNLHLHQNRHPRWHIDYLLLDPHFRLRYVIWVETEEDYECRLADFLGPPDIRGFGCSDCRCPSHLFYRQADPKQELISAMKSLGIAPVIKTIKSFG